jgi:hypothetical protein
MASADHFEQELLRQMGRAGSRGAKHIVINSAELQRLEISPARISSHHRAVT